MNMIRNFLKLFLVFLLPVALSCSKQEIVDESDIYESSENESFVENSLMDDSATRLWTTPVAPNADEALIISFKAGKKSALKG